MPRNAPAEKYFAPSCLALQVGVSGQYLVGALGFRGGRSVRPVRSADAGQDAIDGPGGERAASLRRRGFGQVRHVLGDSLRGSRQRPPTNARAPGNEGAMSEEYIRRVETVSWRSVSAVPTAMC